MKRPLLLFLCVALLLTPMALSGCKSTPSASSEQPAASSEAALPSAESEGSSSSVPPEQMSGAYPVGKMFVTTERLAYKDGDLILRVPRMGLETRVVGGFSAEVQDKLQNATMTKQERIDFFGNSEGDLLLKTGVVLLNSSALPDPFIPNPNVSISGHRDVDGSEFYDIHKMTTGDKVYLTYANREYVYEWQSTVVHEANDWSITYCGDESIVSLISCDPIGTSRNRIVAVSKLVGYRDLTPEPSASPAPTA